jgi:hypothetical protein
VECVLQPVEWKPATREEFPRHGDFFEGGHAFNGGRPSAEVERRYLHRTGPEELRSRRGAANPVRYVE